MELRQLQHFLALAEHRSFRGAAESVHLTQQAVSKSIAQLETRLGVRLFDRKGRTVTLTPFGMLLLPYARNVTAELRHFDDRLEARRGSRAGSLRVGATPTLLGEVVPETLRRLHVRFPRLVLSVDSANWDLLAERLVRGELDLVVSTAPVGEPDEALECEPICEESSIVVAARGHPLAGTQPGPAGLARHPWIAIRNLPRADEELRRYFSRARRRPPVARLQTDSTLFALAWVERTEFLCVLPSRSAERDIAAGRIVALDIDLAASRWNLVIARRREGTQSSAAVAFEREVRQIAAGTARLRPGNNLPLSNPP